MAFFDTLSRTIRAAYPAIVGGVRQGLSANSIIRLIRDKLGSVGRRATVLQVIARERAVWEHGNRLRFLNLTQVPNLRGLPEALTKIRRAYSFTVEVRGFLTASGEPFSQFVTVATSRGLTRAEIQEQAVAAIESGGERYGMTVTSAVLVAGLRAGGMGVFR